MELCSPCALQVPQPGVPCARAHLSPGVLPGDTADPLVFGSFRLIWSPLIPWSPSAGSLAARLSLADADPVPPLSGNLSEFYPSLLMLPRILAAAFLGCCTGMAVAGRALILPWSTSPLSCAGIQTDPLAHSTFHW